MAAPITSSGANDVYYRITRCGDMVIRVSWGTYGTPIKGRGGRRGSAMAPFERAMVVSNRLSIVTVALCVIVRNLRSNVSDTQINKGGSLWAKISGCSLGVDP